MVVRIKGKNAKISDPKTYFNSIFSKAGYMVAATQMRKLGFEIFLDPNNVD